MAGAAVIRQALRDRIDHVPRLYKDGPGEYAEGDKFLGVTVPNTRIVAKQFRELSFIDLEQLLASEWHDERLCALFILVWQYAHADAAGQKQLYDFYLAHISRVNNWDLVDASAHLVVGPYLADKPAKMAVLQRLAASDVLWERRIAMIATYAYIRAGRADEALVIARQLLYDKHDLIQKAVGWMLREIGKRVGKQSLVEFLDEYAATMPRTALRYAVEHLPAPERTHYMAAGKAVK